MHSSCTVTKLDAKLMVFDRYTCCQRSRYAHVRVLLKGQSFLKASTSILIRAEIVRTLRLQFSLIPVNDLESLKGIEMRDNVSLCKLTRSKLQWESWRNRALWILLVSGSAVWSSIGLCATSEASTPSVTTPIAPIVLRTHSPVAPEDTTGPDVKQLASNDDTLNRQLPPAVIIPGVSSWAADLGKPNIEISIVKEQSDTDTQPDIPATFEVWPNFISADNSDRLQQPTEQPRQQVKPTQPPNSQSTPTQQQSEPTEGLGDPDLGRLRLRERRVPPRQPQPVLHVVPRISYFYTNNVFSGVDPIADSQFVPSVTVWSVPQLRPGTYLSTSIDGYLIRYFNESQFDYNFVRFRAGISQRIAPRTFGEIGWSNQQYFRASNGDRFLNEHSVYLTLSRRDWLRRKLALDYFYDVRLSFADPDSRSRASNYLSVSLSYYFQPNLQVGMDYQFSYSDFTKRDRLDRYHRLLGRLTYGLSRDSQINVQGGATLGNSNEPNIDFDSLFFSVTYSVDWQIFD